MREIPTTYAEADALLRTARSEDNGKPVANNTRLFRRGEDAIALRLHSTDVVIYHADGRKTLHTGGWYTVTTKDRINAALPSVAVYSERGRWMVAEVGAWENPVPFYDGMTITPGEPLPVSDEVLARVVREDAQNRAMRRDVNRYIAAITPERIVEAFDNTGGDCWGCMMVAQDGSYPLGSDCVALHVEEGYFHAHLVLRALRAKGYRDPMVIAGMIYGEAQRGRVSSFLTRDLRSFLRKQLTVGSVAVA